MKALISTYDGSEGSAFFCMKSTCKILVKMIAICLFLYLTPFANGLKYCFRNADDILNTFVYKQSKIENSLSLKDSLNVLSYNSNLTIPKEEITVETTQDNPIVVPKTQEEQKQAEIPTKDSAQKNSEKQENSEEKTTPKTSEETKAKSTGKRVYIYDTHQDEGYQGGKTVLDAAAILSQKLEDRGIKVVLETNDFIRYRDTHGLNYNQSYVVSYKYLSDALVNYGGFDLCLDLHRDSIPREASFISIDGKNYAKGMFVVGGLGKHAKEVTQLSTTLTDTINAKKNGIMKGVMTREAYYNQEVADHIVLMELGGDVNTFEEVSNSLDVIADGIYDVLTKE